MALRFDASAYPHEPPQLWVRLDLQPWQKMEVAPLIELAPDPPHFEHLLRIVFKGAREWDNRWKTPLQTAVVLTGIGLAEGGKLLDPPPRPALRIEFLGDSITEGVLLHRLDRPFPEAWPERADGRLGYAFQTGERLGADTRVVGFGRQGVTIEGNGGVPPAPDEKLRSTWHKTLVLAHSSPYNRDQCLFASSMTLRVGIGLIPTRSVSEGEADGKIDHTLHKGGS